MNKVFSTFLVVWILSACGVSATPLPTPTATAMPTSTPLPTMTFTPTAVPIPSFMDEFIDLGYDQQALDGDSIHAVLDEKATFYASDEWGRNYKKSRLFAWSTVYYMDHGRLQTFFVLMDFCTEIAKYNDDQDVSIGCYVTSASLINTSWFKISEAPPAPHTIKWTKTILDSLHQHSVGDYPIVRIEFNSESFNAHNIFSEMPDFSFFQDVYPAFNGQFTTFKFPGIKGDFLPATYVEYDFSEGKWIQNP